MLAPTPFFFKKPAPPEVALQRNISRAEVQTPAIATPADIVALFECEDNNVNTDPNAFGIYGNWAAAVRAYQTHVGVLNDNGFSRYLYQSGIQVNGWGAGDADTYYNLGGMTFSWIARITPVINARLLQYWQADVEKIDVYFSSLTEITTSVMLGAGTEQTAVADISATNIANGTFHHFAVSFHPGDDRICRLYMNGNLLAETLAVAGAVVFGDTVADIRRGIAFGCHYTSPDLNIAGDIDHCTILRGYFEPVDPGGENLMTHEGNFLKYFNDQMLYNPPI
jgi:hypothetical protein